MANRCLNLSQHSIPCRQEARRSLTHVALAYRFVHRPAIFGMRVNVSESSRKCCPIKRAVVVTASLDSEFSDEEFSKKIQELALRFQVKMNRTHTSGFVLFYEISCLDKQFSEQLIKTTYFIY